MPKLSDFKFKSIMAQFIGAPGTGKSLAAASFHAASKDRPCYIFDLQGKIDAVAAAFPGANIEYDHYRIDELDKMIKKLNEIPMKPLAQRPKTIILDDLSTLTDMLLQYAIGLRGGEMISTQNKGKFKKGVIDLNDLADYNLEARGLLKVINAWKEPEFDDINRILITHLYEYEKENIVGPKAGQTETKKYTMTGGQKLGPKIPGYFNEVYEFYTEGQVVVTQPTQYLVNTKNNGENLARTILGLPPIIDFTKRPANPEGSFWLELEKALKEKGFLDG